MAFVLTLCMVLPLISNQYLVVRAEESEAKGIFSLAGSCQTIDMTQTSSKELPGQTYTEDQYQYMISPMGNQYGTDNGALYKITLAAGQMIKVEKDGTAAWGYWYIDSGTDLYYYSQGNIYKNQENDTVNVYYWIAKSGDSDTSFSFAVKAGQKITDVSEKASAIEDSLNLSRTADNYVEDVTSGSTMLSGWLYKTTGEKTYRITDLKTEDYISVALFDEVGSQTITLMAEDYEGNETTGDELSSQFHVTDQIKYILILDDSALDGRTLTVGQAKKLSEIKTVREVVQNVELVYSKDDDKEVTLAAEKCYLYELSVPANSMVGLTVTIADNNYYTRDVFYVYDEDSAEVGSKTDTGAILNNSSNEKKTYYVAVLKSETTSENKSFSLNCKTLKQVKDCTYLELNEKNPKLSFAEDDSRFETVAMLNHSGTYDIAKGILIKLTIPTKSTVTLNKNYFNYYEDLEQPSNNYYEDYWFSQTNDTDEDQVYYIFVDAGIGASEWEITVSQNTDPSVPVLEELKDSAILLTDETTVVDQTQAMDALVKTYSGETVQQSGVLYKYEIPPYTNVTFSFDMKNGTSKYAWQYIYEDLNEKPIISNSSNNYSSEKKTIYVWTNPIEETATYTITKKETSNEYKYTTPYDSEVEALYKNNNLQDVYLYSYNSTLQDRLDGFFGTHPEYLDNVHFVNKECDGLSGDYRISVDEQLNTGNATIVTFTRDEQLLASELGNNSIISVDQIGTKDDTNLATYYKQTAYDYTIQDGSLDGTLKMVSGDVYPGCFMYNKTVAREVLGTDDPDEVQAYINDWDGFYAVAEKAKTGGYYMTSGSEQVLNSVLGEPERYQNLLSSGYETGHETWSDDWYADMEQNQVFGYFSAPDTLWALDDKLLNNYEMCIAPCAYVYGGTYYAANEACKDNPLAAQILYMLTCDTDAMASVGKLGYGDLVNNQQAVRKLAAENTTIDRYPGDDAALWKRWDTYAARIGNDSWLANKLSYGNYAVQVDDTNSFKISQIGNGFDTRFLDSITVGQENNVESVEGTGDNMVITVYDTDHVVKYNYTIGSTTYALQFAPYKADATSAQITEKETQLSDGGTVVESVTLENGDITGKQAETTYGTYGNQVVLTEVKDGTGTVVKEADISVKQDSLDGDKIQTAVNVVNQKNTQYKGDKFTTASIGEIDAVFSEDAEKTIGESVFEGLKDQNVVLSLSKENDNAENDYTWTFEGNTISDSVKLKTSIAVEELDDSVKQLIPDDDANCVLDFSQEGKLPGKAEVTVNVADKKLVNDGSVYCYYYDEASGKLLEKQPVTIDADGNVTIHIAHCCKYVLTNAEVEVPNVEVKIEEPETKKLELGSTIQLSATVTPEGETISWTSDNPEVAEVDSTGLVTAKQVGTVKIKAVADSDKQIFAEIEFTVICSHKSKKIKNEKEASCTEEGYTGDSYCADCGEKLELGEKIAKKAHTYSDWIVDKVATVDAEGHRYKECTVCKTVLQEETIAKIPTPEPTPTPEPEPVVTPNVTVSYRTHVQSIGWQDAVTNGAMSGTSGMAKRLEGIEISVAGNSNLGIQYTTHCQSYGWLPWSANGEMNGTEGEAKRLEAIKIQLTGSDKDKYNVYYRVHAQSYGWLAWAANGAPAGTAGLGKRLEGIQIVIVKKGESFDHAIGNIQSVRGEAYIATTTANADPVVTGESNANVEYRTHVQSLGWQGWKYNGQMSGTSGMAKRLEGINIRLTNKPYSGSIAYTTHVQSIGWQGDENNSNTWFHDGQMAGTSGRAKRLEAIRIALTGEMAEHYDVYYRVHAQSYGWLGWAKNGEAAGTAGLGKRLEGIQVVLVPKGGAAPARNYGGVVTTNNNSYIKR